MIYHVDRPKRSRRSQGGILCFSGAGSRIIHPDDGGCVSFCRSPLHPAWCNRQCGRTAAESPRISSGTGFWTSCEKRKYAISLAVEELATNTVMTGFRPGRHNTIDMRILKKGDDYFLRVRDDCEIFDPVKQLQLYDSNVPLHHMGLRLAISQAQDVQYTTMLKLNNLVLRV